MEKAQVLTNDLEDKKYCHVTRGAFMQPSLWPTRTARYSLESVFVSLHQESHGLGRFKTQHYLCHWLVRTCRFPTKWSNGFRGFLSHRGTPQLSSIWIIRFSIGISTKYSIQLLPRHHGSNRWFLASEVVPKFIAGWCQLGSSQKGTGN